MFFLSVSMTVVELAPRIRTGSCTPLPLSAISTICHLIPGNRLCRGTAKERCAAYSWGCYTDRAGSHSSACRISSPRDSDNLDTAHAQEPSPFSFSNCNVYAR